MADIDVALVWIAMSVISVKGLAALARATATRESEAELATIAAEGAREQGRPFEVPRFAGSRL